jgi:outer membrane protein assembly factor BamB
MAVDALGDLLIADAGNGRVARFSSSGDPIGAFDGAASADSRLEAPTGVAVDPGRQVYVATGNRLLAFDPSGGFVRSWREADGTPFSGLVDVAAHRDGRIFALDAGNGRVIRIEPDGQATAWGSPGDGDGQLRGPTGLAVNAGSVVVSDTGHARIVEFDVEGTLLRSLPVPEWAGLIGDAADVAINDGGTIWASSPATNSIVVYRPDGTVAGSLAPGDPDQLDRPSGLALRPGGALFVSNLGSNRITLLTQPNP